MTLFDTRDVQGRFAVSSSEECSETVKWSDREMKISDAIGKIEQGKTIHFVSQGCWSCYELLKYILKQTGPADVDAFTWNLSMPAVTSILQMRQDGMIRKFRMLVHSAMKKYTAEALSVLQSKIDKCVLYQNHAKGFIIENDNWKISVITSANFSNNVNIEGGGDFNITRNIQDASGMACKVF